MWPCILLISFGVIPVFGADQEHSWDTFRDVFYTHRFTNGQVYEHEDSLDHAPWSTWARFYNDNEFYSHVVAVLDAFLKLPDSAVEGQPALRRAILLRDLWPVFDAQVEEGAMRFDGESTTSRDAWERKTELRSRLAKIMRRLELSEDEAAKLPDNYKAAFEAKLFSTDFDPQLPEKGFMPDDLFDETGPWLAMARGTKTVGGLGHLEAVRYRSIFVPYIRVSDHRQDSIDYLDTYRRSRKAPPKGTVLALVRRMALPTTSARMVVTPVMESLQLIVVDPPRDKHFKFVLDRAALIAGRPGLRQLKKDDVVDAYSFEDGGLFIHQNKMDADGEQLVLGRYAGPIPKGITSLGHCIQCHGSSVGSLLFANFGASSGATPMSWVDQSKMVISHKEESASWKMYQAARK
jgi:hypothetical protein